MSVYPELTRLTTLLAIAQVDPCSSVESRSIIQARIDDLKEEAKQVGLRQAAMILACEAKAKWLRGLPSPQLREAAAVERALETWLEAKGQSPKDDDHVGLWEAEQLS